MSEFPTITLSACEDDDDDEDDALGVQRDSVMEVGEVGVTKKLVEHFNISSMNHYFSY